jgi:hypothetical protein
MNQHDKLHHDAKAKRDKIIAEAKAEYRATVQAINSLRRRIHGRQPGRPRTYKRPQPEKTVDVAEAVLRESGPLSLVELTLAVMARGHRSTDDPRAVSRSISNGLGYRKGRFSRDGEGKWMTCS